MRMRAQVREHLTEELLPFWMGLRDEANGGFIGEVDEEGDRKGEADKGCILNSRILWFFSHACLTLRQEGGFDELAERALSCAAHAFAFCRDAFWDKENGGVFWSVSYDGKPVDTTKHTYCQAFAIYGLAAYYDASGDEEALAMARALYETIEGRCRDENGYLEAFALDFSPASNEKLSENGVMAERTMNTLLHVFEAYTELYRVTREPEAGRKLGEILDLFVTRMYNPVLHRQEVFFDRDYHSLIDLHSYGHDIETAWLLTRGLFVLGDEKRMQAMRPIILDLTEQVGRVAFNGRNLYNECEKGVQDRKVVWWVQAETVIGFLNGWQLTGREDYLEVAKTEWQFIRDYVRDEAHGGEWHGYLDPEGRPLAGNALVDGWKCPYHNGRMCFEVMKRLGAEEEEQDV